MKDIDHYFAAYLRGTATGCGYLLLLSLVIALAVGLFSVIR